MAIKTYRPYTPTRRFTTTTVNDDLTTNRPYKPLTEPKQRTGGRRNSGDLTIWHRGGGHKRKLRIIDFKRDKTGVPATVASIEYDPNRSARIALLNYADGEKRYIVYPVNNGPASEPTRPAATAAPSPVPRASSAYKTLPAAYTMTCWARIAPPSSSEVRMRALGQAGSKAAQTRTSGSTPMLIKMLAPRRAESRSAACLSAITAPPMPNPAWASIAESLVSPRAVRRKGSQFNMRCSVNTIRKKLSHSSSV